MNYQDFIKTELLILVPVLYILGLGLKKSRLPDKKIPVLLGSVSFVLSTIWVIATSNFSNVRDIASAIFTAVTQGILIAGASVYANQIYVQAGKEE